MVFVHRTDSLRRALERLMKYFQGYVAWRTAFFSMMEIEQPEELRMSVAEHCLPNNCRYVTKTNDASEARLDVDARPRVSQARKKRYNTKVKVPGAAEPA